jgi:hypothetical protein
LYVGCIIGSKVSGDKLLVTTDATLTPATFKNPTVTFIGYDVLDYLENSQQVNGPFMGNRSVFLPLGTNLYVTSSAGFAAVLYFQTIPAEAPS